MRRIITSNITPTVGQPFKNGSLDHLQASYSDLIGNLAKSMIGAAFDFTKTYILYGCEATTTGGFTAISSGAVYHAPANTLPQAARGEVFFFAGVTLPNPTTGVYVCNISPTFYTDAIADPVTMTDGTTNNVHEIRSMTIAEAATHTGTMGAVDFSELLYASNNYIAAVGVGSISGVTFNFKRNQAYTYAIGASGTVHLILDFTSATPGNEINIQTGLSSGTSLSITSSSTFAEIVPTPVTPVTSGMIIYWLKIKYLGRSGTTEYISVSGFGI